MKGARRPHVALGLIGFALIPHNLTPNHMGQARSATQFIQESGGQAHGANIGTPTRAVQTRSFRLLRHAGGEIGGAGIVLEFLALERVVDPIHKIRHSREVFLGHSLILA